MWHHQYPPQGGCPPQGFPPPQQYGIPDYPPPQQQHVAPQGYPPQQQQFSPPPGQYPPQQHSYGAPPTGQYGVPSPGPLPGQYGAPPLGQYVALPVQHYSGGPPASHIRKVKSLATSRVESEDAMSTSTHDSSPPSETTDSCYWCSRISLRESRLKPSPDERKWLQELFYSDCECRRRDNALPSSACGFCKHLNLRHIVRCAFRRDKLSFPTIFSDWYCRKNPQNGCQLCEYIAPYGASLPEIGLGIKENRRTPHCVLNLETINGNDYICLSQDPVLQLQEHVDWELIRGWLSKTNSEKGYLPVDDFRVIDVDRNCIVTPDYPVNYAALSYVWGNSSQEEKPFQATTGNIDDLEVEGSLSSTPLPRTITDAMEVCRQLNRQYLWVDRLCIIQDHESKHGQIQRMDDIYYSSEFTIIALSGHDANHGLAGVSKPRKSRRLKILEWQEITVSDIFPSIGDLIKSSCWGKRGWTFQEEFYSNNNLFFTEYGVYCSGIYMEGADAECYAIDDDFPTEYFRFPETAEAYAARSFTDPGDFLRAFTGFLNMQFDHHHYFGNPTPVFTHVEPVFYEWIHWQPVHWNYEARRPPKDMSTKPVSHTQPHKTDIFPSWSWTSAQGGVRFYQYLTPVALWACPVAQGSQGINVEWVSTMWDGTHLRRLTVEGGLMRARDFPIQLPNDPKVDEGAIPASTTPFKKADRDEACKGLGRILSFTQIASLRLESLGDHLRHDRSKFRIMSSAGECIGGIRLPKLSLKYTFNKDGSLKEEKFGFMALSFCCVDREEKRILKGVGLKYTKGRKVLNVMLIHYAKDSNVARRLGIGQVFKDQWLNERPVLKTVILE